jgi:hypothetical protein
MVSTATSASLTSKVVLCVDSICSCGKTLAQERERRIKNASISLIELVHAATQAAKQVSCPCGLSLRGYVSVSYWLAGHGPWIVAEVKLGQDYPFLLSTRFKPVRLSGESDAVNVLSTDELETAHKLGQPVSARSAWSEALFCQRLSRRPVTFPYGSGMKALVDVQAHPKMIDLRDVSGTEDWLPAGAGCYLDVSDDVLQDEAAASAKRTGLTVSQGEYGQITVALDEHSCSLVVNAKDLLYNALSQGVSFYMQSDIEFAQMYTFLGELYGYQQFITNELRPESSIVSGPVLHLQWKNHTQAVNLLQYASWNLGQKKQALKTWKETSQ